MKNIKRLGMSVIAIVITLTMVIPALAADPISVSIGGDTVTVNTSGGQIGGGTDPYNLTIHKYDVPTPDAAVEHNGQEIPANDDRIKDLKPMPNVVFRITEVKLKAEAEVGSTDLNDYEPVADATPTYAYTDANGEINWTKLKRAIYKVEEILVTSNGQGIIFDSNSFLVSLPVTLNGSVLSTVHVYPKNQRVIDKELVTNDVNGNVLPWKITVDIPGDIEDAIKLEVTDQLDSRLVYTASSLNVYYTNKDGEEQELADTYYTVTDPAPENNNTLTITILPDGFTELAKGLLGSGTTDPKLYIEFSTVVNLTEEQLDELESNPIENTAQLDFTNKDGNNYTTGTDPVPVPDLFGIRATKVDGKDNTKKLQNAKFNIYTAVDSGNVTGSPLPSPSDPTEAWEVVSDGTGIISIPGLAEGTYYLVEVLAPNGYNLLTGYKTVVVNAETDEESDGIENLIVTTQIENYAGFILPKTGGTGTLLFTLGGLVLAGTAIALFVVSRKTKKDKDI